MLADQPEFFRDPYTTLLNTNIRLWTIACKHLRFTFIRTTL